MIDTTLGALVDAEAALARLAELKLPVKAAYHLKKLIALAKPELQHYREVQNDCIKELGEAREPTDVEKRQFGSEPIHAITPASPNAPEFQKRINELRGTAVSLPWDAFDLSQLADQPVTASDLMALGPLATMPEETSKT